MTIIVWPDGSMEEVNDALVAQAISEGARVATAMEGEAYNDWLAYCD